MTDQNTKFTANNANAANREESLAPLAELAKQPVADKTAHKQRGRPFPPGKSGNPSGRPKGTKNRFADKFVSALIADFEEYGELAIDKLREMDPRAYLQMIYSVIPKDAVFREAERIDVDELSAEEVMALLDRASKNEAFLDALRNAEEGRSRKRALSIACHGLL